MARIPPSPYSDTCSHRYYLAFDRIYDSYRDVVEEDRNYGLVRIPIVDALPLVSEIKFYNDTTGLIDLLIREYSQAEWETIVAFDALPVLHSFDIKWEHCEDEQTLATWYKATTLVRFNDH